MVKNRLQIVSNNNEINNINVNIYVSKKKYCSKCLSVLGDEVMKDHEDNEFCNWECKKDFYLEKRQDMDDILSNYK